MDYVCKAWYVEFDYKRQRSMFGKLRRGTAKLRNKTDTWCGLKREEEVGLSKEEEVWWEAG